MSHTKMCPGAVKINERIFAKIPSKCNEVYEKKKGGWGRNLTTKLHFLLMPDTLIPVQTPLSRWTQPASPSPWQAAGGCPLPPQCSAQNVEDTAHHGADWGQ